MGLLIFFFLLSIGFSFLCSILEAVLLSVTPSYVSQQQQADTATGKLLTQYKKDIDRPLSAILTLNTIAHTVGAIGVGAQAGTLFESTDSFYGISYESIIAGVMTLAILILSEIIPKTIGANNWRALSPFSVRTIKLLILLLSPFVAVSQFITKALKKDKLKSVLSRADFTAMTQVGEESGALKKEESAIIKNVLNFEKRVVRDIMTPRTVAFMVQEDTTIEEFLEIPQAGIFSRIPVFGTDKDHVTGVILKNDMLKYLTKNGATDSPIKNMMKEIKFVQDQMPLTDLFQFLVKEKQHLCVVKDEFGNAVGLVTMEDMFETLLGVEIVDESDKVIDLQKYAREKHQDDISDSE
ncbi:MAG: HlyC/CorC family transporter [Saprospiraceae bacterium]|nr:HlyC/CorC family transporter [Saprospiraceae bacterium]